MLYLSNIQFGRSMLGVFKVGSQVNEVSYNTDLQ